MRGFLTCPVAGCDTTWSTSRMLKLHAMASHGLDVAGLRRVQKGRGALKTKTLNDPIVNRADRRGLAALLRRKAR